MRILIYGAGVIGSLYASKFAKAGIDVTMYAQGARLKELKEHGLWYRGKAGVHKVEVNAIDEINPDDRYQFVFLTVGEKGLEGALEELKENISPNIVIMANTLQPYSKWEKICGKGRILPAFPGVSGCMEGGILDAQLLPRTVLPTTFGEIGGRSSNRQDVLAYIFRKSHIPYQIVSEMHHWQVSHLGVIVPMADAYRLSKCPERICADEKWMTLTAVRIKKNLRWIDDRRMLCPSKLHVIKSMPTGMLANLLSRTYQSELGHRLLYKYVMNAPDRFRQLHQELYGYMKRYS